MLPARASTRPRGSRSAPGPHGGSAAWALRAGLPGLLGLLGLLGCAGGPEPEDAGLDQSGVDLGSSDAAAVDLSVDQGPLPDFGALPDLGIPADRDTDADGLCDVREIVRGTRIDNADSDGDEVPDYYEFVLGTNPLDPSTPTLGELLFLPESVGASVGMGVRRRVSGAGENFSGAFVAYPVSDPEALSGASFFVRAFATSANPMGNVALVVPEEERYYGVVGSTELGFEVELAVPSGFLPRGCGRVYPLRYDIKRSDGRFVGGDRRFLVVLPVAGSFAEGPWCFPARCI
ncbi:MAG: hypothetical protein KC593_14920 [Myxococcales bacterium]|nr:hypothetical protein [Myxococcales bacterium]